MRSLWIIIGHIYEFRVACKLVVTEVLVVTVGNVLSIVVLVVFGPRRFVNLVTSLLKVATSFKSSSFS